jgi:hypothetical protein
MRLAGLGVDVDLGLDSEERALGGERLVSLVVQGSV